MLTVLLIDREGGGILKREDKDSNWTTPNNP